MEAEQRLNADDIHHFFGFKRVFINHGPIENMVDSER